MKTILEFELPEETQEMFDCLRGPSLKGAIQDFDNFLRGELKYKELTATEEKIYSQCREKLHDIFDEKGVSVW